MKRFLKYAGIALAVGFVVLMIALAVARALFNRYLHSEAFRQSLAQGAANALGASHAEFAPLEFDGSTVYGQDFRATREDRGGFSSLDADQLRASFDWHGLLRHTVQIDEMTVQRLNIEPPVKNAAAQPNAVAGNDGRRTLPGDGRSGWTVDLRKASISETNWHWSEDPAGGIYGTALTLTPNGREAWIIDAAGGVVQTPGWPDLDLDTASMRWQSPTLYINSATLKNRSGRLAVTGSIQARQAVDLRVKLDGVDVKPLLSPDWRERLTGKLTGPVSIHAPIGATSDAAGALTVSGSLALLDGQLTALPILDEIGLFTHTQRFRQLDLTRASANFTRTPSRLEVRDVVVESEGLIRVEGTYSVVDGQIDGSFQVGLTPATLQWIPGSQEQIFASSHDGYRWTPMRLSGPVGRPVDDLTPRLVAATSNAVIRGVENVEGTVKKAGQGVLDLLLH